MSVARFSRAENHMKKMPSVPGVHNRGVYNDFHVCRILTQFFAARAMPKVYARPPAIGFPLSSVTTEKYYQCHHGMGISGNRSSTTNIFSSDSFGISVIYTFWAIHPCKNNHLPISFRAVIVNSNLSNLFLTITALEMLVK